VHTGKGLKQWYKASKVRSVNTLKTVFLVSILTFSVYNNLLTLKDPKDDVSSTIAFELECHAGNEFG
jgi:hypothetical protein